MRLFAVRGATSVDSNTRESILKATTELLTTTLERNELAVEQIVSCMFTCTPDLNSEFPAVAARDLGFQKVPLLCAQEIHVIGAMPKVVRTLTHYYAEKTHQPTHVYLDEAKLLRLDLDDAQ